MSEPFIGEIKMFAGNFAPRGYAFAAGQIVSIASNTALFSLLGTTYGGNGQTTFALPDMRGRVPVHMGQGPGLSNYSQGQLAGTETVTLISTQIPQHNHNPVTTSDAGNVTTPGNTVIPARPVDSLAKPMLYVVPGTSALVPAAMAATSIGNAGGNQPHPNMMPTVAINYIIALEGIFPSRN